MSIDFKFSLGCMLIPVGEIAEAGINHVKVKSHGQVLRYDRMRKKQLPKFPRGNMRAL